MLFRITLDTWVDQFLGSDPGLTRLRTALRTVLTIAVILVVEAVFVHLTHALQIDTAGLSGAAAAKADLANHEFTIIAMLLGAIVGLISSFVVNDATAKGQLVTFLFIPVVMIPTLALGLAIGGSHIIALIALALILAGGIYLRRFGPRGFAAGMLLFMGDFFGFFMSSIIGIKHIGWLAAEILVGLIVALIIRFVFFYPNSAKELARTQQSYNARARKTIRLALILFNNPTHRERDTKRLERQLLRLNETALMIDAQLGDASAVPGNVSGLLLHQRLFDVELALTNTVRYSRAIAKLELPKENSELVLKSLNAIVDRRSQDAKKCAKKLARSLRDNETKSNKKSTSDSILLYRFAGSVIDLADGITAWSKLGDEAKTDDEFEPSVKLFNGWLPGSNAVSANASREQGSGLGGSVSLQPYTRFAIQMGVAVSIAIVVGSLLSAQRFYWAVIAVFTTFMGVNNTSEQIRKALYRFIGTLAGIIIGSLLVNLIGHHTNWSIVVILVALFLGIYLMRISYVFMSIGITVMISQLYVELGEFSNELLLLRLAETAIGAVVVIVVVTLVLPLRTRRVFNVALREHLQAVSKLVDHTTNHLIGKADGDKSDLRNDARAIDVTYQALVATAQPLRRSLTGSVDQDIIQIMRLSTALHNYSRTLVIDVEAANQLDDSLRPDLKRASRVLRDSLETISTTLTDPRHTVYASSSEIFDRIERSLQERTSRLTRDQLVIRDLKLLDGAMVWLADTLQMVVTEGTATKKRA